jgi:hypothetical protein
VFFVENGWPGRGLDVDFGVDASTGMFGAGVPRTVTKIVALVILGFGVNVGDVVGGAVPPDELLL